MSILFICTTRQYIIKTRRIVLRIHFLCHTAFIHRNSVFEKFNINYLKYINYKEITNCFVIITACKKVFPKLLHNTKNTLFD